MHAARNYAAYFVLEGRPTTLEVTWACNAEDGTVLFLKLRFDNVGLVTPIREAGRSHR